MGMAINYIIESSVSLGILSMFYRMFLRKNPVIWFNRFYLLASLAFSTILPLLHFSTANFGLHTGLLPEVKIYGGTLLLNNIQVIGQQTNELLMNWIYQLPWLQLIYFIGLGVLTSKLIISLTRIFIYRHKSAIERNHDFVLVDFGHDMTPFSFFRIIFMNKNHYQNDEVEMIVQHELSHIRLKHSYDIIFLELVLVIQWFNPFAWLVRKDLKEVHEFQADSETIKAGTNLAKYRKLLVFQTVGTRFEFAHNFNHSLTKKRLKMMNNNLIKKPGIFKIMAFMGIMLLLTLVFGADLIQAQSNNSSGQKGEDDTQKKVVVSDKKGSDEQQDKKGGEVFNVVEEMPEFPGGMDALKKYITEHLVYPKEAEKKGIQGKVYVSYVISDQGKVKDVKIERGVDPLLDNEAIRVIKNMPEWKPGKQRGKNVNVRFTIPVYFALK